MGRKAGCSLQITQVLLALLSARERWRHGYDLSRETGLKSGTLYPLLIRLKDRGLLDARWSKQEREGLPPRHEYRLTAEGIRAAEERAAVESKAAASLTGKEAPA